MSGNTWIIIGIITAAFSMFAIPYGFYLKSNSKEKVTKGTYSAVLETDNEFKKEAKEKNAQGIRAKMSDIISEEFKQLIKKQVTPWSFYNSKGVRVKKFDGEDISISGSKYNDQTKMVFFNHIESYIEGTIKRMIEKTAELAKDKNVPISMVLSSTEANLSGGIDSIYHEMQKVDRRLRGGGDPESVPNRDVSFEVKKMNEFLDRQIKIAEDLHFEIHETGQEEGE